MRRRGFLYFLGGAAAAWPFLAHAQGEQVRRIGVLMGLAADYPDAQAVIAAAPDRIIWGTDWPHSNNFAPGHTPNDGDLLDLLAAFAPDEVTRKKLLVDNPARLYGFE